MPYGNSDKVLLISRNQVFCLKNSQNRKLWRVPTTIDFNNFCWNFAHVPYLPMSTKRSVLFLILFRTWVICQNQKIFGFYKLTKARFIDKSGSKQNTKNPIHPFVDFRRPSFQFFIQITCNHSPNMEMALVCMGNI